MENPSRLNIRPPRGNVDPFPSESTSARGSSPTPQHLRLASPSIQVLHRAIEPPPWSHEGGMSSIRLRALLRSRLVVFRSRRARNLNMGVQFFLSLYDSGGCPPSSSELGKEGAVLWCRMLVVIWMLEFNLCRLDFWYV